MKLLTRFKMNLLKERAISHLIDLKLSDVISDKGFLLSVREVKSLGVENYDSIKELASKEDVSEVKAVYLFVRNQTLEKMDTLEKRRGTNV